MLKISLLQAPDYMILIPKIEKSFYRGRGGGGGHPLPHPPPARGLGRSARSHLSKIIPPPPPPPHFGRPVYASDCFTIT